MFTIKLKKHIIINVLIESFEDQPEIEHYRPKGRGSGDNSHVGYYWLNMNGQTFARMSRLQQ